MTVSLPRILLPLAALLLTGWQQVAGEPAPPVATGVPFPAALDAASVMQTPMATEIPGAIILGNGDLNGILWINQGRLRFSITKNDACDGRLDTSQDPELVRIDVAAHRWTSPRGAGKPLSWDKPYPCPLICGHVEFDASAAAGGAPLWSTARQHKGATIGYDAAQRRVAARIEGAAGDSAGWWFVPKKAGPASRVTARLSGSSNAKWYLDLPGTGVKSLWRPATAEATEAAFDIPAGMVLRRVDLYVWTNDGKPAEIYLHSVAVDQDAQPLEGAGRLPQYQAKLDLARAVAAVTRTDGARLTARVLASRNVAVFETPGAVSLSPCLAPFIPASKTGLRDGVHWVLTTVPGDIDWPGMSFALACASKGSRHAVAVVTSREASDPLFAAVRLAGEALAEDSSAQAAAHEEAWRTFWSASGVSLSDAYLEATWYRNLYFLRCCSKRDVPPIGLFMGCSMDAMPWHGVATTDYNFEQCFWPAFVCNHPDLAEPYNRFMADYLPRGAWFARETYGLDGAFYPVNHFVHQINDPGVCKSRNRHMNFYLPWTYVPGANGWQAHNVWLGYLYRPDRKYLESTAYPVLREMARFYSGFLGQCKRTPQGKAVYGPSYSPEHRGFGVDDTPCDIAWTRFTLKAAICGAQILDRDAELVTQWRAALALVPDYPTVPGSNPPIVSDVRDGGKITFNVAVPALPVFPAGEVNWWSPQAEKKLFADTVQTLSWTGYNSTMILAGARARLSMPETWLWVIREFQARQMPSGFLMLRGDTRGNYTEQMAAAGIVGELLLQSVGGVVRLFPAWPRDKDARFERLLAEGGFEVSAAQKQGLVTGIRVLAPFGGEFQFLSPWPKPSATTNGRPAMLHAGDRPGVFCVKCSPGDQVDLAPIP